MSLEKWSEYGWLRKQGTSPEEIADLWRVADRSIQHAQVEQISDDLRFYTAFNAILALAAIPLRASGYRTSTQLGHHLRTLQTLELTIGMDARLLRRLEVFSRKRNTAGYDSAGSVSRQELWTFCRAQTIWIRELRRGCVRTIRAMVCGLRPAAKARRLSTT